MKHTKTHFLLLLLIFKSTSTVVLSWQQTHYKTIKKSIPAHNLQKTTKSIVATAATAAALLLSSLPPTAVAIDNHTGIYTVPEGLKPATPNQPQIQLPTTEPSLRRSSSSEYNDANPITNNRRVPILQGLIYFKDDEQNRPSPADTLVITAVTSSSSDSLIAGAKIPLAQTRFPMQFSMYLENLLGDSRRQWNEGSMLREEDLIVTAAVCPEDSAKLPCREEESTFRARGIAKVIRGLPGMKEGDSFRSAAALELR